MKIKFLGATKQVTGSKHLIQLDNRKNILLDCGLVQGRGEKTDTQNRNIPFPPSQISAMILSHAHIDHSGMIPKYVKEGFKGPIYCTLATLSVVEIMLKDCAHILAYDAEYLNKKRPSKSRIEPLYTIEHVNIALSLFVPIPYNEQTEIMHNVSVNLTEAGHILGSAVVNLAIQEKGKATRITFSGDVGRINNRILKDRAPFPQCDYLISECTYGNRLHGDSQTDELELLRIIKETCVMKKGNLIIPAFSLGRTQEIVFALNNMEFENTLPDIPVFVDSPLAVNATEITRNHSECFNDAVKEKMQLDETPFNFKNLHYVTEKEASIAINQTAQPCIIISSSGMMDAGRVKHHIKNNIENPRNTLLIVGYCEPSTLGGRILDGHREITIFGRTYRIQADIVQLDSFSAHADYEGLLDFISCQNSKELKKIFLVHGGVSAAEEFKTKLFLKGYMNVEIPSFKDEIILD